jgi:protein dithiol oxidoreductase (disulfide-forming)
MGAFRILEKLVLASLFALATVAAHAQISAGKEYLLITPPQPAPPGKNVEVIEFFWYGCPHCADLQPSLKAWLKKKPADVSFRSHPAAFNEGWTQLARTYYAIEVLGETEKLHGEIFNAIHKSKKLDQNVDVKKFTDAYNSFSVVSRAQRTVDTTSAYGVNGTPSLAIDGRYVTAPHMLPAKNNAVDYDGFFKTVDALIAMARAARKGK